MRSDEAITARVVQLLRGMELTTEQAHEIRQAVAVCELANGPGSVELSDAGEWPQLQPGDLVTVKLPDTEPFQMRIADDTAAGVDARELADAACTPTFRPNVAHWRPAPLIALPEQWCPECGHAAKLHGPVGCFARESCPCEMVIG